MAGGRIRHPLPGEGLLDAGSRGPREGAPAWPHVALDRRGRRACHRGGCDRLRHREVVQRFEERGGRWHDADDGQDRRHPPLRRDDQSRIRRHRRSLQCRHQHHLLDPGQARIDHTDHLAPRGGRVGATEPDHPPLRLGRTAHSFSERSGDHPRREHGHHGQGRRRAPCGRVDVQLHRGRRQRPSTPRVARATQLPPGVLHAQQHRRTGGTGRGTADVGDLRLALADARRDLRRSGPRASRP